MKRNTRLRLRLSQILSGLLCIGSLITFPRSQQAIQTPPASTDRVALHQALLDLTNPWTVMCIAAHPDDEDGTSLIVMRRKYGAHTVSLFTTFGEGGQNAIGPELYEELGAIRARETMAAAEIQGSEPHFLGLKDFGYSKSADEAFRVWGHEEALRRIVLQIRKLRPDVIITNHSTTNNDHGHHQATARLELEAFDAAADPKRFSDQLSERVRIWQVQRLFVRERRQPAATGGQKPDREGGLDRIVTIDPNERDPIRDTTFAEEALRALQQHATQGPWPRTVAQMAARFSNSSDGRLPLIRYRLAREAKGAQPLTLNPDSFLAGLVLPAEMIQRLGPWGGDNSGISLNQRDQVVPRLRALVKAFRQRNSPREMVMMPAVAALNKRLNAAIAATAGITVEVTPKVRTLVPGTTSNFDITVTNRGSAEVQLLSIIFDGMGTGSGGSLSNRVLAPGRSEKIVRQFTVRRDADVTVPHHEHLYDGKVFGEKLAANVGVSAQGQRFDATGTVFVDVAPAVEIADVTPSILILTPTPKAAKEAGTRSSAKRVRFTIKLINHSSIAFDGNLIASEGLADSRADGTAIELAAGETRTVALMVQRPAAANFVPRNSMTFLLQGHGINSPSRSVPVVYAAALVASNLRVGYVRGFDFSLPNALSALGVKSQELSVAEVKTSDLKKYSTIIVDNRVYESQPELIKTNQRLMDYAKDGGTLIVFYHKSNEWNPDERRKRPQLAPYKLVLGDERITDETAPITFIEPDHPLLNTPNVMGQEDFANWIQERGLYYPKDWDPTFHALLQSNDPGEAPLKGGLLVADYGRGHYIYSSMVWYRQLRAGVPGAYRMLANMISYGKTSPLRRSVGPSSQSHSHLATAR